MASGGHGNSTIGIDLGTTYCAVAHLDNAGHPVTLPNAEGELTTPSVVLFERNGNVVVGREARAAALLEPESVADFIKREMGEPVFSRKINGKSMSPSLLSGLILKKLKQDAEARLGEPVDGAVITVPAYFDEGRRQATVAAGKIADLKVLDILNEPTSAALAYAFRDFISTSNRSVNREAFAKAMEVAKPHTALIYDLGGGTFDVTILRIVGTTLMVLATDGDVRLGGHDWDLRVVDHAAEGFIQAHGGDPRTEPQSMQNLLLACENAKRNLSQRTQTRIAVSHAGRTHAVDLTRDKFDELTADLLYRTERRLSRVLDDAGLKWPQVDQILTVGGSTRMPQVLTMLQRVTGRAPNVSLSPDEVVAHGAAIHAVIRLVQSQGSVSVKQGKSTAAAPPAPAPAAAPPPGDEPLLLRDDDQPAVKPPSSDDSLPVLELDEDDDDPIVLDDDAALQQLQAAVKGSPAPAPPPPPPGAARPAAPRPAPAPADSEEDGIVDAGELEIVEEPAGQGGQADNDLTGVLQAIHTINVNAHSLGVVMKAPDGSRLNSILIPRNTPLPTSITRRYGTVVDNQTAVTVRVVEGESTAADDCIPIGKLQVCPLPWGLRKGSTIYVTFSYDNSGRLHVKAVEATTGSQAATVIERHGAMDAQHVEEARQAVQQTKVI